MSGDVTWPLEGRGAPADPTQGGNPYYWMRRRAHELITTVPDGGAGDASVMKSAYCAAHRCGVSVVCTVPAVELRILSPPTGCDVQDLFSWFTWDPDSTSTCLCGDGQCRYSGEDDVCGTMSASSTGSHHRRCVRACSSILSHPGLRAMESLTGPWAPEDTNAAGARMRAAARGLASAQSVYKSWSVAPGAIDRARLGNRLRQELSEVRSSLRLSETPVPVTGPGNRHLTTMVNNRSLYYFSGGRVRASSACKMSSVLSGLRLLETAAQTGPASSPDDLKFLDKAIGGCVSQVCGEDMAAVGGRYRAHDWPFD